MKYLRSTRGKTVALAICIVCAVLLVVAVPVLKPTVIDLWYRQQLQSLDPDVRAQAVESVCANPSPMAARELMRMFKEEDEAASIEAMQSADPQLFPYIFESVEDEANWFLLGSSPPGDEERNYEWLDRSGIDYFDAEAPIERTGGPDHEKLKALTRTVQLVGAILRQDGSGEGLGDLRGLGDAALLIIFAALRDEDESLNALVYRWHPVGLASRNWIVRSAALDSLLWADIERDGLDKLKPEGIIACVRDENPVLQQKALEIVAHSDRAILLPEEVIPQYAPLLLDGWRWHASVVALSSIAAQERHRDLLFDSMNAVYTKYLADPSGAPNDDHGYGFPNAIHDIAGAVFDCRDVPDLIQRLSLPAGECEFSLESLLALTPECELPRATVDKIKRFVGSHQYRVRIAALFLCDDLPVIDQELTNLLLEAARDEEVSIRGAALMALGDNRLVEDLALQVFGNALKDDSWYCRDIAISELEDLGDRARKPLLEFLETVKKKEPSEDDDPDLVKKLEAALQRLDAQERGSEE